MKKILILILCSCVCYMGFAQTYGGEIRAKNNPGVVGNIGRTNDNLKVRDSSLLALIAAGVPVTGTFWQATQPVSGTFWQATQPVSIASLPSLAAGSNNIGDVDVLTLPALPAGSNNIGDIDVLTVPADPFGVNADAASATGSISAKLRFIAATGIPITGTVAVTQSGTWNLNNISGTISLPTGASTEGTLSSLLTSSQLIDDAIYANDGAISKVNGIGAQFDDVSPGTTTENNVRSLRMSTNRNLYNTIRDAAGNERGANVNASNELLVAVSSIPSHAVTNAGVFATQIDGAALTALQLIDNIPNTIGSTTSGQSGVLGLGATTTAAPSYTTAQSNPLSLQTNGSLRTAITDALPTGSNVIGAVTQSGTWNVGSITTFPDNEPFNVAQINGVTPLMGNGSTGTGSQRVTLASDMTAISTTGYMSVKFDQTTLGTTNGVTQVPSTTGGLSTYHLVSAASTNATNIKASAGQVYGWYIFNANAAARKVAFHNSASTPTAGASVFYSLVIPAGSGANVEFANGLAFSSGIGITTVTGTADSDATGVAAGDLIINIYYK